jgi:hypothetical protein
VNRDETLRTLRGYRAHHAALYDAVREAARLGIPQTVIARESGLSRSGVRKILGRDRE